jgi:hypothetical protein
MHECRAGAATCRGTAPCPAPPRPRPAPHMHMPSRPPPPHLHLQPERPELGGAAVQRVAAPRQQLHDVQRAARAAMRVRVAWLCQVLLRGSRARGCRLQQVVYECGGRPAATRGKATRASGPAPAARHTANSPGVAQAGHPPGGFMQHAVQHAPRARPRPAQRAGAALRQRGVPHRQQRAAAPAHQRAAAARAGARRASI